MIEAHKLNTGECFIWQDGIYRVVRHGADTDIITVQCFARWWPEPRNRWVYGAYGLERFNAYCEVEEGNALLSQD